MKKIYALSAFIATFAGLSAIAQVTPTANTVDPLINDIDLRSETIEQLNKLRADITNLSFAVRVDTNANVVYTNITPAFVGQLLVTPASTNKWLRTGNITNSTVITTNLLRGAVGTGTAVGNWFLLSTDQ